MLIAGYVELYFIEANLSVEVTWEQGEESWPSQRASPPKFHRPTKNHIDDHLKGGQHRISSGSLATPPRHEKHREMFIMPL